MKSEQEILLEAQIRTVNFVTDKLFPVKAIPLRTRRRAPDYQWDTQALGKDVTVDIYCWHQVGDRGDIYNPPEKKGMVVEYAMIGSDRIDDEVLIKACQEYVDEAQR